MPTFQNWVTLDGTRFEYESGSWARSSTVKSSRNTTQGRPSFQYNGLDAGIHKLNILALTGSAPWIANTTGYSQRILLQNIYDKKGTSMPVIFVPPTGLTVLVVPLGDLNENLYTPVGTSLAPMFVFAVELGEV